MNFGTVVGRRGWLCLGLAAGLAGPAGFAQPAWPSASVVAEAMHRANDYWIANNAVGNSGWARGAYYTGNQRAARVLGADAYYNWAVAWGGVNLWKIGPEGAGNADAYCCGQTYLDLYQLSSKPAYLADIKLRTDALVAAPAVDGWWWIDAFYMQGPVLARLGRLTGDTNYYQKLALMYDDMKTRRGLYDSAAGLWYRDASFFYPGVTTANGQKVFWSRGNGWVFAGLARLLEQLPASAPNYPEYVSMFQTMAAALKPLQGGDGLWRPSLLDASQFPNPETSGTGFYTYGLAWGIRHGFLPAAEYSNTVALAWQGLTNLALNASGRVGYVQGVGTQPGNASAANTTDFGVGAFLLASSEIYLLAPDAPAIQPWAGPDQSLIDTDENGVEPITLDASQTEIYRGTNSPYTWWEDATQIASGPLLQTNLALGPHVLTVQTMGSDGLTYSDSVTIFVRPPVVIVPQLKLCFDFETTGPTTTDSVAGVNLNLVNFGGSAADLHGALGTGVNGTGRALNFTTAAAQGGPGPLAAAVGAASLGLGNLSNFTVTLWIKPTATLLGGVYPRLFSLGTNGTADRGNASSLQLLSNGNFQPTTSVQAFVNATQSSTSDFGAFSMPSGQWRFLAFTYDGVTLNFYGGSESDPVGWLSSAGFPAGSVNLGSAGTLMLGNRLAQDRAFRGWLDAVRFYQEAAPLDYLESVRRSAIIAPAISPRAAGTNLLLQTQTRAGATFVLQSTSDLTNPTLWSPIATNLGDGGLITNTVPFKSQPALEFFRYLIQD